jgi:hypothetical protein
MFFSLSKVSNGLISSKVDHDSVHTFILVTYLNAFICLFEGVLLTGNVMQHRMQDCTDSICNGLLI